MSISVIIPAYNEGQIIRSTIDRVYMFLADNYEKFQVVVIDDGSTDDTLKQIYHATPATVITYEENRGKGYALRKGVEKAWGDMIVLYDADMAYSLSYIKNAEKLLKYFDIVAGTRKAALRYDESFLRRTVSQSFARYVDRTFHLGVSDTQCGFKALRSSAAKKLFPLTQLDGFAFDVELFVLAQKYCYSVAELPVKAEKEVRPSKVNLLSDGLNAAGDIHRIKRKVRRI